MTNTPALDDNFVLRVGAREIGRYCSFNGATGAALLMRLPTGAEIASLKSPHRWRLDMTSSPVNSRPVWVPQAKAFAR